MADEINNSHYRVAFDLMKEIILREERTHKALTRAEMMNLYAECHRVIVSKGIYKGAPAVAER